jgi:para-nitrobenzyl esterase
MKRKIVTIAVAAVLAGSLAACGTPQSADTPSDTTSVSNAQTESVSSTDSKDGSGETETASSSEEKQDETASDSFVKPAYAQTENGWLYGCQEDSTYMFKGIQYGVVTERFMPAQKPEAWHGIKAALAYGETAPNTSTSVSVSSFVDNASSDMVQNEQCLYLNVWTQSLENSSKKPVIVFLHGGGFATGASNELACYDGKNISEYGDVVYVNLNHRLNYLGYTDLSAYGDEYAASGDVGMMDIELALQWVQDNIEYFGGDPSNVTIVGQSGGGSKVALLLQSPSAQDLFSKAVILSGTGLNSADVSFGIPSEQSQEAGKQLVENCKKTYGIEDDQEAIKKLQEISYEDLGLLTKDIEGGIAGKPAVNNDYIPEAYDSTTNPVWPEVSTDKPVIISNTFGELAGDDGALVMPIVINMGAGQAFDPSDPDSFLKNVYKPDMTEEDMHAIVEAKYGDSADEIIELFKKGYPSRDTVDVNSLNRARQGSVDLCKAIAKTGQPVYNCIFAYEYPIMGGIMNYHTGGDIPFLFYNLDTREYMIKGDEEQAYEVADEAASALVNFAYDSDPSTKDVTWPEFTEETGETMIFDDTTEVVNYPDQELLAMMNEILGEPQGW